MSFDGFDVQIQTNAVSNSAAALTASGVVIPAFDKIIKLVRLQGGNKLDGIYLSFGLQTQVNAIISPQARYFINVDQKDNRLGAGEHVVSYMSPLGSIPVIGDFFCRLLQPILARVYENLAISGKLLFRTIPTEVYAMSV